MKVFVLFDDTGKIVGTVAPMRDNVNVKPPNGTHVHIIEHAKLNPENVNQELRRIHREFRIDIGNGPNLVKRTS